MGSRFRNGNASFLCSLRQYRVFATPIPFRPLHRISSTCPGGFQVPAIRRTGGGGDLPTAEMYYKIHRMATMFGFKSLPCFRLWLGSCHGEDEWLGGPAVIARPYWGRNNWFRAWPNLSAFRAV